MAAWGGPLQQTGAAQMCMRGVAAGGTPQQPHPDMCQQLPCEGGSGLAVLRRAGAAGRAPAALRAGQFSIKQVVLLLKDGSCKLSSVARDD